MTKDTDLARPELDDPKTGFASIDGHKLMQLREEMLRTEEEAKAASRKAAVAEQRFLHYVRLGEIGLDDIGTPAQARAVSNFGARSQALSRALIGGY